MNMYPIAASREAVMFGTRAEPPCALLLQPTSAQLQRP